MMPRDASPPCIGDASPIPDNPASVLIITNALRWVGVSFGAQLIWNASILVIFMAMLARSGRSIAGDETPAPCIGCAGSLNIGRVAVYPGLDNAFRRQRGRCKR